MSDKLNFEINDDIIQEITNLGDYTITHTRSRNGNSSGYWTFVFYDVEKEDTTYSKDFDSLLETVVAAQAHWNWRSNKNAKVVEYKPVPEGHERLESWGIIKEDFTEAVNAEVSLQPIIGVEQLARLIKGCDSNADE